MEYAFLFALEMISQSRRLDSLKPEHIADLGTYLEAGMAQLLPPPQALGLGVPMSALNDMLVSARYSRNKACIFWALAAGASASESWMDIAVQDDFQSESESDNLEPASDSEEAAENPDELHVVDGDPMEAAEVVLDGAAEVPEDPEDAEIRLAEVAGKRAMRTFVVQALNYALVSKEFYFPYELRRRVLEDVLGSMGLMP